MRHVCANEQGQICTIYLAIFDRKDCCAVDTSCESYCTWGMDCQSSSMDIYSICLEDISIADVYASEWGIWSR